MDLKKSRTQEKPIKNQATILAIFLPFNPCVVKAVQQQTKNYIRFSCSHEKFFLNILLK